MADSDLANFMCISLSDSETETDTTNTTTTTTPSTSHAQARADRTALSEEAFQTLKATYRPKVENGEIWKTIPLPLGASVSKPLAQEVLHAVEELYFFRRYAEGAAFARRVLDSGGESGLDGETKGLLRAYEARCVERNQNAR